MCVKRDLTFDHSASRASGQSKVRLRCYHGSHNDKDALRSMFEREHGEDVTTKIVCDCVRRVQDFFIFIHGFNIHDGEGLDDVAVEAEVGNFNVDRANGFFFDSFSKAGYPPRAAVCELRRTHCPCICCRYRCQGRSASSTSQRCQSAVSSS